MNSQEREFIAVGFDHNDAEIAPVLRMSGSDGLKKIIRGVSGISEIRVYHLDFNCRTTEMLGTVPWPDMSFKADVIIAYDPEKENGTVRVVGLDEVWNYSAKSARDPVAGEMDTENEGIVDKEKVRRLEQEERRKVIWPDELASELEKEIYGQDEAIRKISELVAANLRRENPEVEVIVLFGPTGVGKTEVGKMLPETLTKLTGVKYDLRQIALNEFVGEHSINRFFGAPPSYVGYKDPTIFEPVRTNPYQVFLLDEIEKATDRIWTGLMEAFSTGMVHMADNSPDIDLGHAIFIITSNIPVDINAYNAASPFQKKEICRDVLAKACGHPEIAGKITNCIAFQPLSEDALTDIVSKFVIDELRNYGMELARMDEALMVQLKKQHSSYGARGVRDAVREALTNKTIYDRNMDRYKGKRVVLNGDIEDIRIEILP